MSKPAFGPTETGSRTTSPLTVPDAPVSAEVDYGQDADVEGLARKDRIDVAVIDGLRSQGSPDRGDGAALPPSCALSAAIGRISAPSGTSARNSPRSRLR